MRGSGVAVLFGLWQQSVCRNDFLIRLAAQWHSTIIEMVTSLPIEIRYISFSVKEAEEIFRSYAGLVGMILPSGALISMHMTSARHGEQIYLMLSFRRGGEKVIHEVPLRFASKCLMAYCKDHGIPLPMGSNKSLLTNDNRLTFRVQMPTTKSKITKQTSGNELGLIALGLADDDA